MVSGGDCGVLLLPLGCVFRHPLLEKSEGWRAHPSADAVGALERVVLDGGIVEDLGVVVHRVPYERLAALLVE